MDASGDVFVDAALNAAGLPILHVSVQHAYAPAEVQALLDDHLTSKRWDVMQV